MTTIDPLGFDRDDIELLVKAQHALRAEQGDEWNFYDGARRFLAALGDRLLPRDAVHELRRFHILGPHVYPYTEGSPTPPTHEQDVWTSPMREVKS